MWQLKRLSTGEALSEAGDLPVNWGPIFGLHGFLDRLGNLSWLGDAYADMGWFQIEAEEEKQILINKSTKMVDEEKKAINSQLSDPNITVEQKQKLIDHLLRIDLVCLQADFDKDPQMPALVEPDA